MKLIPLLLVLCVLSMGHNNCSSPTNPSVNNTYISQTADLDATLSADLAAQSETLSNFDTALQGAASSGESGDLCLAISQYIDSRGHSLETDRGLLKSEICDIINGG